MQSYKYHFHYSLPYTIATRATLYGTSNIIASHTASVQRHIPRWMVKEPHCWLLAWKFVSSTCRYRVLTVWDLKRLNRATFDPDGMHTVIRGGREGGREGGTERVREGGSE